MDKVYLQTAQADEHAIARLQREVAELSAVAMPGLSAEQAQSLDAFAAEVRAGIEHAGDTDRRNIFELLRLTATVRKDAAGHRFGRKHRYEVDVRATLGLRDSGAGSRTPGTE